LAGGEGFREGLQWGLGYASVKKAAEEGRGEEGRLGAGAGL